MPVADGAGDIRPAAEDPLHAATHSTPGGHTRTEADHAGHGGTSLAGHDERATHGGRAGHDEHTGHGGRPFRRVAQGMTDRARYHGSITGRF